MTPTEFRSILLDYNPDSPAQKLRVEGILRRQPTLMAVYLAVVHA